MDKPRDVDYLLHILKEYDVVTTEKEAEAAMEGYRSEALLKPLVALIALAEQSMTPEQALFFGTVYDGPVFASNLNQKSQLMADINFIKELPDQEKTPAVSDLLCRKIAHTYTKNNTIGGLCLSPQTK